MKPRQESAPGSVAISRIANVESRQLPRGVDMAGKWAWRVMGMVLLLTVIGYAIAQLDEIVIPFLVALLLTAFLKPLVNLLLRHRWPKWLAVLLSVVAAAAAISGIVLLVESQISAGLPNVEQRSAQAFAQFRDYLATSPLKLTSGQLDAYITQLGSEIQAHGGAIFSGALAVGKTAEHLLAGTMLTIFAMIFMLIDGENVWRWTVRLFPRGARTSADGAGKAGWNTLTSFVRVQILVAAGNGIGIGLFAFFLGLPMVIPIAMIVFLGSFIPVIGAIVTGALAVLIALVFVGPVQALIMLGGVLLVHLLEAHVMQPLFMGAAVKVHPLAVVFAVAGGTFIAGVPGALFAVPLVAVVNSMAVYLASKPWLRAEGEPVGGVSAQGGTGPAESPAESSVTDSAPEKMREATD